MKSSLLLPALLLAALPATLDAAPDRVLEVLQEIADGVPGGMPSGSLGAFGGFGSACAPLGDLDGDGNPDLAVGREGADSVHILFLSANGSVDRSVRIANGSSGLPDGTVGPAFGSSLALLGDLDGDGLPELAAGAFGEDAVYILFLNVDGSVRRNVRIADGSGGLPAATTGATQFGVSCTALGDLDGNGVTELAVGANRDDTGLNDAGALYVLFLNPDGTVDPSKTRKIADGLGGFPAGLLDDSDVFGQSCASLGDIDGDGLPELAVGAIGDDTGSANRGAVYVLSLSQDGSVNGVPVIIAQGSGGLSLIDLDLFGSSVVPLGDINGDGVTDLAVGAIGDDTGGSSFGAVHILFLNPDGTVAITSKIANNFGGLPANTIIDDFAEFGRSLAVLGLSPDNGLPVLAVGSVGDDSGAAFAGAVYLLELGDPPLTVTTLVDENDFPPLDGSGRLSLREAMGEADLTGQFRTIRFDPALAGGTIELLGTLIVVSQSLRITGEDLPGGVEISMTADTRVFTLIDADLSLDSVTVSDGFTTALGGAGFRVDGTSSLTLHRVTVANCVDESSTGGGIFNEGRIAVSDCTFVGNRSISGGAILNSGANATLSVLNSTFSGNGTPDALGGAILSARPMVIRHCTFVGNTANEGGAIASFAACTLSNSLFAGNTAATHPDFDANSITDGGGNAQVALSEVLPLADYGGPTQTRPLKPTSSSKSTVIFSTFPAFDQRGEGFPRTRGTGRDPGAVEGTENSDFQPDSRIGLSAARQIGNNVYNASGQGQTVKLTLSGRKKKTSFFTVENDGIISDTILLRSVAPNKKTLKGSVFRLTGGRRNVSAQVFRTGLALGDLTPGAAVAFQAEWSRKSLTVKAKQTLKITASSTIAPRSDTVGAKVGSK